MNTAARIAAAAAALLAAPLVLAACSGPSNSDIESQIANGVRVANPDITDVAVQSTDGVAGRTVWVRVYVDGSEQTDLAAVLDAALPAILESSPVRPVGFYLDVHESPRPDEVDFGSPSSISIADAAKAINVYSWYADNLLGTSTDNLEAKYGTWDELHG